MYQEKNIQIGQNHRRTETAFETRGLDRREGRTRDAWEHYWCKDSVLCILKANLCILELDLYHSSVHTIQSDLCIAYSQICANPTGISFQTKWPSATVFIWCTFCIAINPWLLGFLIVYSSKQTRAIVPILTRQRWSQATKVTSLFSRTFR